MENSLLRVNSVALTGEAETLTVGASTVVKMEDQDDLISAINRSSLVEICANAAAHISVDKTDPSATVGINLQAGVSQMFSVDDAKAARFLSDSGSIQITVIPRVLKTRSGIDL